MQVFHIASGLPHPLLSSLPQLTYVLKGMRCSAPRGRRVRLPITSEILEAIQTRWSVRPVSFDRIMLWAAFSLAFFAFLRAGEFTCPYLASFNKPVMLAVGDVAVDSHTQPSYVRLKRSKNDPFGQGVTLYVGWSHKNLCAVSAVLAYLAIRSPAPGPFFIFEDGGVQSRQWLVTELSTALQEIGLDPSPYKGHSFHIGAATAAAKAGLSDSLIQTLGRWKSSAFKLYVRTSKEQICRVASCLVP